MYPIMLRRIAPYLFICLFVLLKLPDLNYAFYWDESWVYAPAISHMYDHGASLLPDAIPVEYSRGHPLLFHCACAMWMKVFGTSHAAMHSFALCIAVALAIALYEIMHALFDRRTAIISLTVLLLSHFFFVNSSFVLNDIALGLCMLLSLYFYTAHRYIAAGICLTCLFYLKESGFIMIVILAMDITAAIYRQEDKRDIALKVVCLFIPVLFAAAFYMVQKKMMGWYLYPEHMSMLDLHMEPVLDKLQRSVRAIIFEDSNFFCWGIAILLVPAIALTRKKYMYLLVLPAAATAYLMVIVFSFKDAVFYAFAGGCTAALIALLVRSLPGFNHTQQRFIKLAAAAGAVYLYFCCINFFERRYLFPPMLLFTAVLMPVACGYLLQRMQKWYQYFVILLAASGAMSFMFHNDELTIRERLEAQQQLVDYFEANSFYNKKIFCYPYLERIHLTDRRTGFLHSDRSFLYVSDVMDSTTELLVLDNLEYNMPDSMRQLSGFYLLHSINIKGATVEVYQRR